MTDFTKEARELMTVIDGRICPKLGFDGDKFTSCQFDECNSGICKSDVDMTAAALSAAYEAGRKEEREECAKLIEANAVQDTATGKRLVPRQEGNRDGIFYAAAIRKRGEAEK